MACRPKLPTGEKKPPKFQAPIFVPTGNSADLQRMLASAFSNIAADLEGLHNITDTPPLTTPVTAVAGVVFARAGDVLRLQPGPAGIQVLLPAARATNKGNDVSIIVQNATGTVTVRATEGRVQGVASVVLTGDGLRVFRSDGGDGTATGAGGWWIVGRNSADSTAAFVGVSAGTQFLSSGVLSFGNSNGISFGLNASVLTASYARELGLISHVGGNQVTGATRLAFSNASNVTWSLSTAVGGATVLAAVAPPVTSGIAAVSATFYGGSISAGTLVFSNDALYTGINTRVSAQNVLFSLNGSTLGATALAGFADSLGVFVGSAISFPNTNGMSWSFGTSNDAALGRFVVASGSVNPQIGLVSVVGGASVSNVTRLAFSNSTNATLSLSTAAGAATLIVSVANAAAGANPLQLTNAASSVSATQLLFSNANGVSWLLSTNASLATLSASYARELGLLSHVGGNSVTGATRLAFSNGSGVSFGLSTAVGGATLTASVAAAGGGGVAIAASGSTQSDSTVQFARPTALDGGMASATLGNVAFAFNTGASSTQIQATALMRVTANLTTTGGFPVSKLEFRDSNGISWGVATSNDAEGRGVQVTAKLADFTYWRNWQSAGNGVNPLVNNNSSLFVFPLENGPFYGNMTLNTAEILVRGSAYSSTQATASWALTLRGALYTLANSTQLSLLNSFSSTVSSTTIASSNSSSRNNLYGGGRWLTVHSSQWSAQPVLSAGVQYWMAFAFSTANQVVIDNWSLQRYLAAGNDFNGTLGVSQGAGGIARGFIPFNGVVSTGAPPATIGTANLISNATSFAGNAPMVQFRNGIAGGG